MARPVKLLFVCTGNTCRSPLAAAVARAMAAARGLALSVDSAGIAARAGSPASEGAREAAARRGYGLDDHVSRQLTPGDLAAADLVLAMTAGHLEALRAMAPDVHGRSCLLGDLAPPPRIGEIADPWQGDLTAYARTLGQIEAACAGLIERLPSLGLGGG